MYGIIIKNDEETMKVHVPGSKQRIIEFNFGKKIDNLPVGTPVEIEKQENNIFSFNAVKHYEKEDIKITAIRENDDNTCVVFFSNSEREIHKIMKKKDIIALKDKLIEVHIFNEQIYIVDIKI